MAWLWLAAGLLPVVASAQVYRWVDEQGKVHYGDRPVAKEVRRVPVLVETRPATGGPTPGMTVEQLKRTYGEPGRIQAVRTKNGEVQQWTYYKSKVVAKPFVAKVEGGEVTEVWTDSAAEAVSPAAATPVAASNEAGRSQPAEAAEQEQAKTRQCQQLKQARQEVADAERRGGSAGTMDRLRERQRSLGEEMSAQGCSSL